MIINLISGYSGTIGPDIAGSHLEFGKNIPEGINISVKYLRLIALFRLLILVVWFVRF
jgi:hypothetical protein